MLIDVCIHCLSSHRKKKVSNQKKGRREKKEEEEEEEKEEETATIFSSLTRCLSVVHTSAHTLISVVQRE